MSIKGGTFREWPSKCSVCDFSGDIWGWSYDMPLPCPSCEEDTFPIEPSQNRSAAVIGDELHGYQARHGVCNPDGSPRTFYSKTDLKRALNEAGLKIDGDTPGKPYKV